jgi:hypothetical protein
MRKNLAPFSGHFHIATKACLQTGTCPQFLWINLCEIAFPYGKSLIFIREILPLKIAAAMIRRPACSGSARFFTFFVDKIVRKRTWLG